MKVHLVDVFTTDPNMGSPAAVVLGSGLGSPEMGGIAAKVGRTTTFVDGSTLRYYLPTRRSLRHCDHGALAALAVKGQQGRFTVRTPAGDLAVDVQPYLLGLCLDPITFGEQVDPLPVAAALGVAAGDVVVPAPVFGAVVTDELLPICPAGAEERLLLVPIGSADRLDGISPDPQQIAEVCAQTGTAGIYAFTLAARTPGAVADARYFPADAALPEESATGSAAAALGWYLWQRGIVPGCGALPIDQGYALGRPGRILVRQAGDGRSWIYGTAVLAGSMEV